MKISKREVIILLVVGLIIAFLPLLLTQDFNIVSFEETGPIGDTIGGITAPFIGFFGSILLYLTLKAQLKANKETQKQFATIQEKEILEKKTKSFEDKVESLSEELRNFNFSVVKTGPEKTGPKVLENYSGSQAIYQLLKQRRHIYYEREWRSVYLLEPKFEELRQFLLLFSAVAKSINRESFSKNTSENEDIKSELILSLRFHYLSKIRGSFLSMAKYKAEDKKCPDCGSTHGLPEDLFNLNEEIERQLQ